MKLFHGSNTVVDRPDVARSRDRLDFGRGFYLTSVKKQAELWARPEGDACRWEASGKRLRFYRGGR